MDKRGYQRFSVALYGNQSALPFSWIAFISLIQSDHYFSGARERDEIMSASWDHISYLNQKQIIL